MDSSFKVQIRQLVSRRAFQPFWLSLAKLCYAGMNYGGGQMVDESGEQEALLRVMADRPPSKPFLLFDVGANQGSYLQFALELLGQNAHVFSFEPQPYNIGILQQRFGHDARVTLLPMALGSSVSKATMFFQFEGDPTASLHGSGAGAFSRTVPVTTVQQVCRDRGINQIDMLKIDAEGHEMEVLLGARSMLEAGKIGAVQFEFGETFVQTPYHFRDLYSLLAPHYRIYRILRHGLVELPRYSYDLEVYKLANFLCLRQERAALSA